MEQNRPVSLPKLAERNHQQTFDNHVMDSCGGFGHFDSVEDRAGQVDYAPHGAGAVTVPRCRTRGASQGPLSSQTSREELTINGTLQT